MRPRLIVMVATAALGLGCLVPAAGAASAQAVAAVPLGGLIAIGDLSTDATSSYHGWNWANPDPVYLYDDSGELEVVRYDGTDDALTIDGYDPVTLQPVGAAHTVSLDGWPDWGGFYAGPDGYFYVLVGQENPDEDDNLDVVAVRRYDQSWNLVGTAYVKGSATQGSVKGIYSPFAAGAAHMVLDGNLLVVHMGRTIYAVQGVHHQVNLTFQVDVTTMTATTFDELGDVSYSSHSFQQLVAMNGSDLVMVDHGDAYPREIQLGVMAGFPSQRAVADYDLFDFNGAEGDNFTGASVTSLISGPQGVVVLGNSIPQPDAPNGPQGSDTQMRNAFAIAADPATGSHHVEWLTSFDADGTTTASELRSVQVGTDRYAVLYGVSSATSYQLVYQLFDSSGAVLASTTFPGVFYSTICDPVLIGHTAYWVGDEPGAGDNAPGYLYGLDVSDPSHPVLADTERTITPTPGTFTLRHAPRLGGVFSRGSEVWVRGLRWAPTPATTVYHWYRNGRLIPGAHGGEYRLRAADVGATLRATVTVSKPGYDTATASTPPRTAR